MDEITEQADDELAKTLVPSALSEVHHELQAAVDLFRQAAHTDLRARETGDAALLDQATALAEQGNAAFERVTALLRQN
jgi:hypothetical protein